MIVGKQGFVTNFCVAWLKKLPPPPPIQLGLNIRILEAVARDAVTKMIEQNKGLLNTKNYLVNQGMCKNKDKLTIGAKELKDKKEEKMSIVHPYIRHILVI